MKVLSLFNGISCGRVAFERTGIPIEKYIAYEIDEYANKVAKDNYPDDVYLGDVFKADFKQYEGNIDIVIGGSPCTYWSIAQKNNRETEASGLGWELFSQYVRAIKEAKPKYFLYENNYSMSKQIRASIDKTFGFEAVMINSALVSAQNRKRLYWVGKRNADDTYSKVDIQQPEDKGILLKDILETNAETWIDKSYALTTRCNGAIPEDTLTKHRHSMVAEPVNVIENGKARPIHAGYGKLEVSKWYDRVYNKNPNKQQHDYIAEPIRVGSLPRPNGELSTSQAMRIYDENGKTVSITANGGGMGGKTGLYAIKSDGKSSPVYEVKNGLITIKDKQYPIKLADGYYIIRKLTVNECCRLQTLPDNYCKAVSNSRAYKGLGNGWTVDVIAHILKGVKQWL